MTLRTLALLLLVTVPLAGCAAAGGSRDAGRPPPRVDSGSPPLTDAGSGGGVDAGPGGRTDAGSGRDAGSGGTDAGPGGGVDAGRDAGTDAGIDCSPMDDYTISGSCPIPYGCRWTGTECATVQQGCSCSGPDCDRFLNCADCEDLAAACGG